MPLLGDPEVHTNINDKGTPRESPIPGNVTYIQESIRVIHFIVLFLCILMQNFELYLQVQVQVYLPIKKAEFRGNLWAIKYKIYIT